MRNLTLIAVLATAATATAAEPGARGRATVTTSSDFKVGAHAVIAVDSAGGSVELAAGPAGRVHVEVERRAYSEDEARRVDVVTRLDGNTVHVEFRRPNGVHDVSVGFRITAPADARLDLHTAGGSIAATGFGGGIRVETGGGGVQIADARGALQLRSGGGSINVERVDGTVDIDTGGGSIRVDGTLRGKNRVETGGGSIHVAIPADSKLAVDASTGAGSARNDFGLPTEGMRPTGRFHGTIGDGSAGSLELRTGGGSIMLSKR